MHSFRRGFWFFQGHTWTCAHTHAPPHTCAHSASPAVALVDTPHTEALPADISSSVFSLCVSLRPEERRGRCLLLAWQCRVGGGGGAQRWVGVDWVCSATAHGTADNITGLTLSPARAHTHTHVHSWRVASFLTLNLIRAYVYGSEHMWPPLFPRSPLRLPRRLFYLSINVSLCPSHGFLPPSLSDCLSSLIHFTFLAISIAACPPKLNKKKIDKQCGFVQAEREAAAPQASRAVNRPHKFELWWIAATLEKSDWISRQAHKWR